MTGRRPSSGPVPLGETYERMRWALVMCGAADPLRADTRPAAIARSARRVIAALVDVVGEAASRPPGTPVTMSIAQRLTQRLAGERSPSMAAAVSGALVLMADHELATSTLAVRVAASTRADLYDALLAGVATMAGPLHGGASQQAYDLLAAAERDGRGPGSQRRLALARPPARIRAHGLQRSGDPRFAALMALVEPLLTDDRRALLDEVIDLAVAHDVAPRNCDLALAALSWGTGMAPDAGRTIFTVARVAGWTAHYQEELAERPLRFRARAVYSVSTEPERLTTQAAGAGRPGGRSPSLHPSAWPSGQKSPVMGPARKAPETGAPRPSSARHRAGYRRRRPRCPIRNWRVRHRGCRRRSPRWTAARASATPPGPRREGGGGTGGRRSSRDAPRCPTPR